jgi:hypothetical protein
MGITTYLGIPSNLPLMVLIAAACMAFISFMVFLFNRRLLSGMG